MVMGKNYLKVVYREIKNSLGRFLAIIAIVALGVGFLVGLLSTTPDLRASVDTYYKEKNMLDILIKSTTGLNENDKSFLEKNIEEIETIMPAYVTDIILDTSSKETIVTRIYGLNIEDLEKDEFINKLTLIEGELPKNNNEVLIQKPIGNMSNIKIGDVLKISEENSNYEDTLKNYKINEYKVVGIVENPFYYSIDKEPSQVGAGKLNAIVYGFEEIFDLDVYTDFLINLDRGKEFDTFSSEYKSYVEGVVDKIEEASKERTKQRDLEVKAIALDEVKEAEEELSKEEEKVNKELSDAKSEIDKGYLEIEEGRLEINNGYEEINLAENKLNEALEEIENNKSKLDKGYEELLVGEKAIEENKKEIDEGKSLLDASKKELEKNEEEYNKIVDSLSSQLKQKEELNSSLTQVEEELKNLKNNYDILISQGNLEEAKKVEEKISSLEGSKKTIEENLNVLNNGIVYLEDLKASTRESLDSGWEEYNQGYKEYEESLTAVNEGLNTLNNSKKEIEDGYREIDKAKEEIEKAFEEIENNKLEIKKAEEELEEGLIELQKGEKEYNEGLDKANKEFLNAKKEIEEAKEEIENLDKTKWYVLDKNSNVSFVSYKLNTQKVDDIAKIFPVFFFLVAALVTLTTMTRMVEEERLQIGTLKALGFTKFKISLKYIAYCGIATIIGCIIGLLGGFRLLPFVIYQAYGFSYNLPELVIKISFKFAFIACGLEILCTMAATIYATMHSLKEKPYSLLVAKAPKEGQRIWLERLPFIWKNLTFSYKATARNIFRNKKNLIMTITGIAGCTALMITAFGIKDSIGIIADKQFSEIQLYDMKIEYIKSEEKGALEEFLKYKNYGTIYSETSAALKDNERINLTTYVSDYENINEFIMFKDRGTQEEIIFDENSVIITEKAADILNISVGDLFEIENAAKDRAEFKVTGITENYIGSFIYISKDLYNEAFSEKEDNLILLKSNIEDSKEQDEVTSKLLASEEVSSVEFISSTKEVYDNLIGSLNIIVLLIIFVAGALAVIVLYNIINVNINERIKELATLRVLGFHNKEVDNYIFREIRIMVAMGIVIGLALGIVLHRYVILVIDTAELMVGRDIRGFSYLYATVATLVFAELVRLIMIKKIKGIKMAESMKSVD